MARLYSEQEQEELANILDGGNSNVAQFTDEQVAQALRESMAQGFTLDQSLFGAANKFGVSQDQLSRVQGLFQQPSAPAAQQPAAGIANLVSPASPAAAIANLAANAFADTASLAGQDEGPDNASILTGLYTTTPLAEEQATTQDQLDRVQQQFKGPDVIGSLQNAGLQEKPPELNRVIGSTAAAPTTTTKQYDIGKPQELIKSLMLDPNLIEKIAASRQQAFDLGEASTYTDYGVDVGGFNVKKLSDFVDFGGGVTPGGFEALKKDVAPDTEQYKQLGVAGRPVEIKYTYDAEGNIVGTEQRFFKGGDSGIVVNFDAQGKPIDARQFDYSEGWKQVALPLANMALMAFAGPAAGSLTTALQPTLGALGSQIAAQGIVGAGRGAILGGLTGQDIGQAALRGGVTGAAGAGLGQLANLAGTEVGKFIGPALPEGVVGDFLQNAAAEVTKGLTTELGKAAVGSVLTGRPLDLGSAAMAGALSGLSQATMNTINDSFKNDPLIKSFPKPLKDAAFAAIAAELRGKDPGQAVLNSLVKEVGRTVYNAAKSSDLIANLSQAGSQGAGGVPFETSAIFEGTEGAGGSDVADLIGLLDVDTAASAEVPSDKVEVTSQRDPGDVALDYFFSPEGTTERVPVTGKNLPVELAYEYDPQDLTAPSEQVVVPGKRIQPVDLGYEYDPQDPTAPSEQVVLEDKKIIDDVDDVKDQVVLEDKKIIDDVDDVKDQVVEVVDKKITPEDKPISPVVTTPIVTTPTTTPVVTKVSTPTVVKPETRGATPRWQPIPEPTGEVFRPGLANVFYAGALGFGPEGQSMADPTDFQGRMRQARRSMELALEGAGGENAAEDAYERLMELSEERPAATVDELMRIIERG